MRDRYGSDVLSEPMRQGRRRPAAVQTVEATPGLVVECRDSGYCGAVVRVDKTVAGRSVVLEDRRGGLRLFPMEPAAFLIDGKPVTLVRPKAAPAPAGGVRSASGSTLVRDAAPRTARGSRIWVEGVHDAELVEKIWGHDLRVEGIVVEPLHGADDLVGALRRFEPGPRQRVGVLLDHLVPGSKESRIADEALRAFAPHVEVVGHPFVDVWQAVKPRVLGIDSWPRVPKGTPWKSGVIAALGWRLDDADAWRRILGSVRGYGDLEPALLGRVEQLIDFVTAPD